MSDFGLRARLFGSAIHFNAGLLVFFLLSSLLGSAPRSALAQAPRAGEVGFEGTVEVLHEDRDVGSRYIYFLQTAAARLEMRFAANPPALQSGDHVRARGVRTNGVLALSSGSSVETLSAALPNTFSAQRTLVILVNFQDKATEPYTLSYAQGVVETTSNFDLENSFQQTSLDADVTGWYTIAQNSTVCDYNTTASLADQAAAASGVNVSAYPRRVYAFPKNACTWWGLGSVGGNPSRAWVNGTFSLKVLGHEMGHNLGLYHSKSLSCDSNACTVSEYGDGWDIMGNPSAGHFNAFQKERLGWLDYNDGVRVLPPITTVTTDGVYWIGPYESQDFDPKALKILKSTDPTTGKSTYYYVEYRGKLGFDSAVSSAVLLHTGSESSANSSNLWDLDQTTTTADWVLNPGQSYEDPDAATIITVFSADSGGASVSVTFGPAPCAPSNPTVTLAPATAWVIGATGSYTVTVKNNDSGPCAASNFSLSASVPSGWAAAFGSLAAISPGASSSTTLQLTAPSGAADGYYSFTVRAQNGAAPTYYGSAAGIEVCCSGVLAVLAATDKSSYLRNTWVTISVNAVVGATPASGAAVSVKLSTAGKTVATLAGTTDANGNAVLKYKLAAKAATGVYQINVSATANGYAGSDNSASFIVATK
jgi:hypothetical protein